MLRTITLTGIALLVIATASSPAAAQDTCWAALDGNSDGLPLTVADYVALLRAFAGDTTITVDWAQYDINGDCIIDAADLEIFNCYLNYGMSCFEYGYPVPTCCEPELTVGACCLPNDSCSQRHADNCAALGGDYVGDGVPCLPEPPCDCCEGLRDNPNGDGSMNISDLTFLVDYLFRTGPEPVCLEEGDMNGDGQINISDLSGRLIPFMFGGGVEPAPCWSAFPVTRTYHVANYDTTTGEQLNSFEMTLTFYGPDNNYALAGTFGAQGDTLVGQGSPYEQFHVNTPQFCCDYGWLADVSVAGEFASGTGSMLTIVSTYSLNVVMREIE